MIHTFVRAIEIFIKDDKRVCIEISMMFDDTHNSILLT